MPEEPDALGLLALLLLQDSRREARRGTDGELVLLEDQDRSLWDSARIEEGLRMLERAYGLRRPGPYQLQAAIAAGHAQDEPWETIAAVYDRLAELEPSPVVELNRAVAHAFAHGHERGLHLIDRIDGLDGYHLKPATRADLLRRLGRRAEAAAAYREALALPMNDADRRFLERRLGEVA
jgi:RNA polymerase sigma-70 factor (ECF subfamily)